MKKPYALDNEGLLKLFEDRGMLVKHVNADKLKHINYYKLKEFAYPLARVSVVAGKTVVRYQGVSFDDVLRRYYQDKNLRLYLLHAIEKIEISIKTVLARELGIRYGAFGYLNFWTWANRAKYTCFKVEEIQFRIKKNIMHSKTKATSLDYDDCNNLDGDGFPSIWLAIDLLTFGDVVKILELLNSTVLRRIAAEYNIEVQELLSWIKCLHFIRNICAHNSNLIDIKITTKPKCRKEWKAFLYSIQRMQQTPTNRLAIVICIVMYLVKVINPKYKLNNIQKSISSLCADSEESANLLGFKDLKTAKSISRLLTEIKE